MLKLCLFLSLVVFYTFLSLSYTVITDNHVKVRFLNTKNKQRRHQQLSHLKSQYTFENKATC